MMNAPESVNSIMDCLIDTMISWIGALLGSEESMDVSMNNFLKLLVGKFFTVVKKLHVCWSLQSQIPARLWESYARLVDEVELKPEYIGALPIIFSSMRDFREYFDIMSWNDSATCRVTGWIQNTNQWIPEVKRCVFWILSRSKWNPIEASGLRSIAMTLAVDFDSIFSESDSDNVQVVLMDKLSRHDWSKFPVTEYEALQNLMSPNLRMISSKAKGLNSALHGEINSSLGLCLAILRLAACMSMVMSPHLSPDIHISDTRESTNNWSVPHETLEKSKMYTEYCVSIIKRQIETGAHDGPFSQEDVSAVLGEILHFSEASVSHNIPFGKSWTLDIFRSIINMLNAEEIDRLQERQLWSCLSMHISTTTFAVDLIHLACFTISSVEQMAFVIELCIERYLALLGRAKVSLDAWTPIVNVLATPELNEDGFIRHSLQNALVLTIYAHFLQKLSECGNRIELRIILGEQLASWIVQINIEALYPIGQLPGKEKKMILLLSLFAALLAEEFGQLKLPQHHSRLRSHLPQIGESLIKWSEDRGTQGLWATIGLGPKSRLSPNFRLFCKILGSYVIIRLLSNDADDIGWDTLDLEVSRAPFLILSRPTRLAI